MGCPIRGFVESEHFSRQCADISSRHGTTVAHVDTALNGLTWAISNNAEGFRVVRGLNMRVGFAFGRYPVPALKVYFKILGENQVELLWVEEDEEGYSFREGF